MVFGFVSREPQFFYINELRKVSYIFLTLVTHLITINYEMQHVIIPLSLLKIYPKCPLIEGGGEVIILTASSYYVLFAKPCAGCLNIGQRGDRCRDRERRGMCGGIEKAEGNPVLLIVYAFYS